MPDLLLPRKVVKEIQKKKWVEQRARYRAKLDQLLDFDDPVCKEWNPHLKDLDPLLKMGRAKPLAYEPGWGVIPNYYHWVRDNPTTAPTVTPITAENDSWCEPDSGVLEQLRRSDLQNPLVFAALLEQNNRRDKEQEKQEQVQDQERQQEIFERLQAARRTQVLTSPDVRWSQNASGKRGRDDVR